MIVVPIGTVHRVQLEPDRDGHLLIMHSNNNVTHRYRLTDSAEEWIVERAPRTQHRGNMLGYVIDFANADLAFEFKMRWA